MTYVEAKSALTESQSALDTAQALADSANAALSDAQTAFNIAQAAVAAFHRYTTMKATASNDVYTNVRIPEDAEVSGDQITVYRDTAPDPVQCDISSYNNGSETWSEPSPYSLTWTDNGSVTG